MSETKSTLYVIGINDYYQFGLGHKDKVDQLTKWGPISIEEVATSGAGLIVTDSDGNHYAMGNGHLGECAVPSKGYITKPAQVDYFTDCHRSVSKIFANTNGWSIFWLTSDGAVYGNGRNESRQLGVGDTEDKFVPIEITLLKNIVKISSSAKYSLALDTNGAVFRCGDVTNASRNTDWKRITNLPRIVDVASGDDHSLFLSEDGIIYGRGRGDAIMKRLLGYSIMGVTEILSPIPYFRRNKIFIKKIACGRQHNLCVDNHGQVWSWGDNSSGQCGDTPCVYYAPRDVAGLKGETAIDVKCGSDHSYVRTAKQEHFLFGSNQYNECSLVDVGIESISIPHSINQTVKAQTKGNIEDVVLGANSTMIVVAELSADYREDGEVIGGIQDEKLLETISALESEVWHQKKEIAALKAQVQDSESKYLAYVKKIATEQVRKAIATELKTVRETKEIAVQKEKALVRKMEDDNKQQAQTDSASEITDEATALLKRWNLHQYIEILVNEMGYDWVEDWRGLTLDDLTGELQFKTGHAKRFMKNTVEYFKNK